MSISRRAIECPFLGHNIASIIALLVAILFFVRAGYFAGRYGGIEHDSGYFLNVAVNLAKYGKYATSSNTLTFEKEGAGMSVHARPTVQDNDGFIHFSAEVSVGPGYIVPEAILLKLFGMNWWTYRAWALLSYFGLIFSLVYLVGRWGGLAAQGILSAWLWLFPELHIQLAYESLAEHTAVFYFVLSLILFELAKERPKHARALFLGAGLAVGLAVETKLILAMGFFAYGTVWLSDLFKRRQIRWGGDFLIGFFTPIAAFECYRFLDLLFRFGPHGRMAWLATSTDAFGQFWVHGSGLNTPFGSALAFLPGKLFSLDYLGFRWSLVGWALIAGSFAYLLWRPNRFVSRAFQVMALSMAYWLTWFLLLCPNGVMRYAWGAFLLAIFGMSLALGLLLSKLAESVKKIRIYPFLFAGAVILFSLGRATPAFQIQQDTLDRWHANRWRGYVEGFPTNPVFPLKEQKEIVRFFSTSVSPKDRIYYIAIPNGGPQMYTLLVRELPPLVDKIFYPLPRYVNLRSANPEGGRSLLIEGPYLWGDWPWQTVPREQTDFFNRRLCEKTLYQSRSYFLCELKVWGS